MIKPIEGQQYKHKNGNIYTVLFLTNTENLREDHPIQVVYQGENGNKWSRPLSDWYRSFELYTRR